MVNAPCGAAAREALERLEALRRQAVIDVVARVRAVPNLLSGRIVRAPAVSLSPLLALEARLVLPQRVIGQVGLAPLAPTSGAER